MIDAMLDSLVEYCAKDEIRAKIQTGLVSPMLQSFQERFAWILHAFRALTVLIGIQTVLLIWVAIRVGR